ncbi:unnamed protein product [Spodoptera littoralis]|uniref:LITAF domain-containing protein n=1 Tax=Spodoptera littoralis TaxID=7109 RepID=A0A9P0HX09_SPOLI|nr:unnamed protein product [Spodoptera littoralis]CAH1635084.1 unnamed protein product [Spodoptera littoralis]
MNSNEMFEDQELLFDQFATPSAPVDEPVPVAVPTPDPVIVQQPQGSSIPTSASIPDKIGPEAECMICKSCNKQIFTRIESKTTTNTFLIAGLCCLLLCWPCACYLYRSPLCRKIDHYCPNCDVHIAKGLGRPPPYTEFVTPPPPVAQPVPVAVPAPVPVIIQQPQVSPIPISVSIPDNVGPEAVSMICKSYAGLVRAAYIVQQAVETQTTTVQTATPTLVPTPISTTNLIKGSFIEKNGETIWFW